MHIFTTRNFDFLRWRWHAIALSWIIIIAGIAVTRDQGDSARRRVRRRHRRSSCSSISRSSVDQVRAALDKSFPGGGENAIVQTYGDPAATQVMIRVPHVGAEQGTSLSTTAAAGRGRAEARATSARFTGSGTRDRRPDGRRRSCAARGCWRRCCR